MLPRKIGPSPATCCHRRTARPARRTTWELAAGAVSLGVWAFMPKCPMCVAAHVALWTGLGISFTQANYLRWSLLFLSTALLCYVIVKKTRALARP